MANCIVDKLTIYVLVLLVTIVKKDNKIVNLVLIIVVNAILTLNVLFVREYKANKTLETPKICVIVLFLILRHLVKMTVKPVLVVVAHVPQIVIAKNVWVIKMKHIQEILITHALVRKDIIIKLVKTIVNNVVINVGLAKGLQKTVKNAQVLREILIITVNVNQDIMKTPNYSVFHVRKGVLSVVSKKQN